MKDVWITLLLASIVITKALDLVADRSLQLPAAHLLQETVLLLLSLAGCVYLIYELRQRSRTQHRLLNTISLSDSRLAALDNELRRARSAYAQTIRSQFERWHLSRSEQDVAMLLLKGLSLRDIAVLRETREKTVRQQASGIYAKSGLEGRHALAAWFLEDFLADDVSAGAAPDPVGRPVSLAARQ